MPSPESSLSPEHREPIPESLEHWLREALPREYKEQVQFLRAEGLLELLPHTETMGVLGIDGKEYPIPLPAAIERAMTANAETMALYATKIDHGFIRLQLTPFAKPVAQLCELLRRSILQHYNDHTLFSSDGETPLDCDAHQPLFLWNGFGNDPDVSGGFVYFPTCFTKNEHGGRTKQQILDNGTGWHTLLLESDPRIPRAGKGISAHGRRQLEAGQTPNEYLAILKTNPAYARESGQTPEDWLTRFLHELRTHNRVLNDYQNPNDSLQYLLAAYHPASGGVPSGYWRRGVRRAYVGGDGPEIRRGYDGACPAVRITT